MFPTKTVSEHSNEKENKSSCSQLRSSMVTSSFQGAEIFEGSVFDPILDRLNYPTTTQSTQR